MRRSLIHRLVGFIRVHLCGSDHHLIIGKIDARWVLFAADFDDPVGSMFHRTFRVLGDEIGNVKAEFVGDVVRGILVGKISLPRNMMGFYLSPQVVGVFFPLRPVFAVLGGLRGRKEAGLAHEIGFTHLYLELRGIPVLSYAKNIHELVLIHNDVERLFPEEGVHQLLLEEGLVDLFGSKEGHRFLLQVCGWFLNTSFLHLGHVMSFITRAASNSWVW